MKWLQVWLVPGTHMLESEIYFISSSDRFHLQTGSPCDVRKGMPASQTGGLPLVQLKEERNFLVTLFLGKSSGLTCQEDGNMQINQA